MGTTAPRSLWLDLDQIVEDYVHNLNVMLRGFKAVDGCDFLETFVPSEDPATSVRDLFELSRDAGVLNLSIAMSSRTAGLLDRAQLARDVGDFAVNTTVDGIELVFSKAAVTDETLGGIHAAYRRKLAEVLASVAHEKPASPSGSGLVVVAERDGARLWANVDPTTHFIHQSGFSGTDDPVVRGLLEETCRILEGVPVVEASDHAVIRLEAGLRDEASPAPVRGAILPQNAGEPFAGVQRLVRDLVARYRSETGFADVGNVFDQPVADSWLRSSNDRRLEAARAALGAVPGAGNLEIARTDGLRRLVVHFADGFDRLSEQQSLLVRAESHLGKALRTPLQLVLEARADKNVIRHLEPRK
jgi:hypothetical protein